MSHPHRGDLQWKVIRSVAGLDETPWDSLAHPSLYLSRSWLQARSRTVKAAERFILLNGEDGRPLASAPCYLSDRTAHPGYFPPRVMTVDCLEEEELRASKGDPKTVEQYRRSLRGEPGLWEPSFVVAAPGRYGGASFREGLGPESARLARDSLIDAVERQSRQDEAATVSWLYLFQGEDPLLEAALSARGYEDMILDAECYLPLDQGSFDGYLSNFRAEYRRKIRYEMAALDDSGAEVAMFGGEALGLELATLERQWRVKYGRTPPVEEIVADYRQLYEHMGDKLRVFVAHKDGKALGFSVFLEDGKTWYSRFGGFDYSAGNLFLYFNLLFYHPLRTMYEKKVEVARYSLKSYEAKRSRGCLLRHVLAYIKAPEGWPSLRPALELIDRAQSARFAEISNRSITKDQAP